MIPVSRGAQLRTPIHSCPSTCHPTDRLARVQFFEAGAGEHASPEFVGRVEANAKRYIGLFSDAASALLPAPRVNAAVERDVFDVLAEHVSSHSHCVFFALTLALFCFVTSVCCSPGQTASSTVAHGGSCVPDPKC